MRQCGVSHPHWHVAQKEFNLISFTTKVKQRSHLKYALCICQIIQPTKSIIGFVAKNTKERQQVLNLGF